MLSEAVHLNGVSYILGDALALPFVDNTFDLVTLVTTLEFVSEPAVLDENVHPVENGTQNWAA
jgi:ubiquinone/menaquinone biosynthesis C-methylase UbiE